MRISRRRTIQFLIAIALSLALWTYVSFTTNPTSSRPQTVPVMPANLPDELVIVDPRTAVPTPLTAEVSFQVVGPRDTITGLRAGDIKASLDLSSLGPGTHTVPVRIEAPRGLRIEDPTPATIRVQLDGVTSRPVSVTVTPDGQLPFLFTLGPITPTLEAVTVTGPSQLVSKVVAANAVISLQNRTSDIEEQVALQAVGSDGVPLRGVTLAPPRVQVRANIKPKVQGQQVSVVPNIIGSPAPGYGIALLDWDPKLLTVLTGSAITGTLTTEPIDLAGGTVGFTQTVRLAAGPNMMTETRDVLITVRVVIEPIQVQSRLPLQVSIAPTNLGEGLVPAATPDVIEITLAGPFDQLSKVSPGDNVTAEVDLQGLGLGTYRLPVKIAFPEELRLVEPINPEVTIRLEPSATPTPEPPPTATLEPATPTREPPTSTLGP